MLIIHLLGEPQTSNIKAQSLDFRIQPQSSIKPINTPTPPLHTSTYTYKHVILMTSAWEVQSPISTLQFPVLMHWVTHVDSFSNHRNRSFCEPWGSKRR